MHDEKKCVGERSMSYVSFPCDDSSQGRPCLSAHHKIRSPLKELYNVSKEQPLPLSDGLLTRGAATLKVVGANPLPAHVRVKM